VDAENLGSSKIRKALIRQINAITLFKICHKHCI